jgi:GTP-sensing pleiotropic transcriptional regulator CodY
MKEETKLVPPSTPTIEEEPKKRTVIKFESDTVDYAIIGAICNALAEMDCSNIQITASTIYNNISIVFDD